MVLACPLSPGNLVLMNSGVGYPGAVPPWATNLTLPQWPFVFSWWVQGHAVELPFPSASPCVTN